MLVEGQTPRGATSFHVDTLDLYTARLRTVYAKQAAAELEAKEETIERELRLLLRRLEVLQQEQIKKTLEPKDAEVEMTEEEKSSALALLRDPRLLERIVGDFERCGVIGEITNKQVGYLAAVSRLLPAPLAVVVQSSSAAGKSSLMDAVLGFVPHEQMVEYSAMTGQALFYMGETDLKHKVLAIVEEEGAQRASYALKLLQSEGMLSIASTGKDPNTGRLITHQYRVEGPVMIFLTTTAIDVDEELLNRCLVLTVNEEREQTQAIHRKQREAQTLEGLFRRQERTRDPQATLQRAAAVAASPGGQSACAGAELPGCADAHAARSHEVSDLDPGHRLAASVPAPGAERDQERQEPGVHRGHEGRQRAGMEADARSAGAFARRAAAADAPPVVAARRDGDQGLRGAEDRAQRLPFLAARCAPVYQLGQYAAQASSAPAGGARVPDRASWRARPERSSTSWIICTAIATMATGRGSEAEKSASGRPQAGVLSWGGRGEQSRMDTELRQRFRGKSRKTHCSPQRGRWLRRSRTVKA